MRLPIICLRCDRGARGDQHRLSEQQAKSFVHIPLLVKSASEGVIRLMRETSFWLTWQT
jgi:hypothetical protein